MVNIRLCIDKRRGNDVSGYTLKLAINVKGCTAYLPLDIKIGATQLDAAHWEVKDHPSDKTAINYRLRIIRQKVERMLNNYMESEDAFAKTAIQVRNELKEIIFPGSKGGDGVDFFTVYDKFASSKETEGTRSVYMQTKRKITEYLSEMGSEVRVSFEEINKDWLSAFDLWLSKTQRKNTRSIHLRNIRAVFNYALDEELITAYPFRKFKIKNEPTRKRSLSVDKLRLLFDYECEDYQVRYIDYFKLIFMLCGINMVDLSNLKGITDDGRIEYFRAKTHKPYSIKVEPEAMEIIRKYKGTRWLVDIRDKYKDYRDFGHRMTIGLQRIGECERKGLGGKKIIAPAFPGLSPYWARHTWATIAASLDIPKETIAAALGHGGNTVTDIYIDFDRRKVDEANRRVLDWVLYGKG